MFVNNGQILYTLNTSTGGGYTYGDGTVAITPMGHFHIYKASNGLVVDSLGALWRPRYFTGGYAIHGDTNVPPVPVSHGCVRVSDEAINWIWTANLAPIGTTVWVTEGCRASRRSRPSARRSNRRPLCTALRVPRGSPNADGARLSGTARDSWPPWRCRAASSFGRGRRGHTGRTVGRGEPCRGAELLAGGRGVWPHRGRRRYPSVRYPAASRLLVLGGGCPARLGPDLVRGPGAGTLGLDGQCDIGPVGPLRAPGVRAGGPRADRPAPRGRSRVQGPALRGGGDRYRPQRSHAGRGAAHGALGFNVVRLGIIWKGLEPGTDPINDPAICTPGRPDRRGPVSSMPGSSMRTWPTGGHRLAPGQVRDLLAHRHAPGRLQRSLRRRGGAQLGGVHRRHHPRSPSCTSPTGVSTTPGRAWPRPTVTSGPTTWSGTSRASSTPSGRRSPPDSGATRG